MIISNLILSGAEAEPEKTSIRKFAFIVGANEGGPGRIKLRYAVDDARGLAPEGWRIPSADDWDELEQFLGSEAGYKMKITTIKKLMLRNPFTKKPINYNAHHKISMVNLRPVYHLIYILKLRSSVTLLVRI